MNHAAAKHKACPACRRFGSPHKHGDRYFYFHNSGIQSQDVMFVVPTPETPHEDAEARAIAYALS